MSNTTQRTYTKVGGSGESTAWSPQLTEKNNFVLGTDNVREGYYVEVKEMPGNPQFGGNPYNIHVIHEVKPDGSFGQKWGVIGDKVLNDRMAQVKIGSFVRVEYGGKLRLKATAATQNLSKTNSYHNWILDVDLNAVPYNQAVNEHVAESGTVSSTQAPVKDVPATNTSPAPTFSDDDDLPF